LKESKGRAKSNLLNSIRAKEKLSLQPKNDSFTKVIDGLLRKIALRSVST